MKKNVIYRLIDNGVSFWCFHYPYYYNLRG